MKFVNRKKEKKELTLLLNPKEIISKHTNNILIICGNEGNGKTGLVEEISSFMKIKDRFIIIEGSSNNKSSKEYYHLDLLLEQIIKQRNKITFNLFSLKIIIENIFRRCLGILSKNILNVENSSTKNKIKKLKNNLQSDITPYYIFFKNAQNMEEESIDLFFNLSNDMRNVMFIFEYTCLKKDFPKIKKEVIKKAENSKFYYVETIDFKEIKVLFDSKRTTSKILEKIENDYNNSKGNLDNIIYEYGTYLIDQVEEFDYNFFDIDTKVIMQLINLSINKIELDDFKTIINIKNQNYIIEKNNIYLLCLENLIDKQILKDDNGIYVSSTSVSKIIDKNRNSIEGFVAYNMLIEYYTNMDEIMALFTLYCLFNDNNIIKIIPKIKTILINKKYPKTILIELEKLLCKIDYGNINNVNERIIMFAVEMFIQVDNYDKGILYLDKIYNPQKPAHTILKAGLISVNNKPSNELINDINELIKKYPKENRISLILKLYKLKIYMECQNYISTKKYIDEIFSIKKYKEYPEFCYLI